MLLLVKFWCSLSFDVFGVQGWGAPSLLLLGDTFCQLVRHLTTNTHVKTTSIVFRSQIDLDSPKTLDFTVLGPPPPGKGGVAAGL